MPRQGIDVRGLDEFRRALKGAGGNWTRELGRVHRDLGRTVAAEARSFARGTGAMQRHFAGSIYGTGNVRQAAVGVRKEANAAFWGAKKRTGWNRRAKPGSRPQFPKWVGNAWQVGVLGQGPLAINPAIYHDLNKIDERYFEAVEDIARRAFPS